MTSKTAVVFLCISAVSSMLVFSGCLGIFGEGNLLTAEGEIPADQDYLISPGDVLKIQIYPDTELNRDVTVDKDGRISLPLLGEIKVDGLSIKGLQKKLAALLKKDYLVNPQVEIAVNQYHSMTISVLGEVRSPGPYTLQTEGETTLLEAIALAGGFSEVANLKKLKIIRVEGNKKKMYRVNAESIMKGKQDDINLQANDIVVVGESWI